MKRADGYGAGFLRAGARALFANGIDSLSSIIRYLLRSNSTIGPDLPGRSGLDRLARLQVRLEARTSGSPVWMDPYAKSRYYHSVVGQAHPDGRAGACRLTVAPDRHPHEARRPSAGPFDSPAQPRRAEAPVGPFVLPGPGSAVVRRGA